MLVQIKAAGPNMARPQGSLVLTIEIHRKIFENLLLKNHFAQMLEIWYEALHALWSFTKFVYTKVPGSKMALQGPRF